MVEKDVLESGSKRPPIGFVSHSECDDDFCQPLYDALCSCGVRPVMDKRDFQPGDDLVRRVFDEGIGESDAIIFVLSPGSVDRPWLRKELSVGVVHELQGRTRLIPVLIKDLPDDRVPPPLAATIWIRMGPGDSIEHVAKQIASVMHSDARPNPVVAPPPAWTQQKVSGRLGLDPQDEVVFAFLCQARLESKTEYVQTAQISAFANAKGLSSDELRTTIAVMHKHYYIDQPSARGGLLPPSLKVKSNAIEIYMRVFEKERYVMAWQKTVAAILNGRASDMPQLLAAVDEPSSALLELIIEKLGAQRDLTVIKSFGAPTKWIAQDSLSRRISGPDS